MTGQRAPEGPGGRVPLGRHGLAVTPYGLGTAPLGGMFDAVGDERALATLRAAWDGGLRLVDTAPHYGAGTAERRAGAFLAGLPAGARDDLVLSTKVGRLLTPAGDDGGADRDIFVEEPATRRVFDYSRDGILRSLESSLARLGTDRVDLLLLHDPDEHWEQAVGEGWPALAELRDQGVVRSIGAGMNQSAMLTRFVRETDLDVVLLAGRYTLLEQDALDDLLPACAERGASVVAGGVLNSGLLAGPAPGATYDYAPAPPEVLDRAQRLAAVCARHGVPLAAAALRFPGAHPVVATTLFGARDPAEVAANLRLLTLPIPDDLWAELRAEGLLRADAPVPATTSGGVHEGGVGGAGGAGPSDDPDPGPSGGAGGDRP